MESPASELARFAGAVQSYAAAQRPLADFPEWFTEDGKFRGCRIQPVHEAGWAPAAGRHVRYLTVSVPPEVVIRQLLDAVVAARDAARTVCGMRGSAPKWGRVALDADGPKTLAEFRAATNAAALQASISDIERWEHAAVQAIVFPVAKKAIADQFEHVANACSALAQWLESQNAARA